MAKWVKLEIHCDALFSLTTLKSREVVFEQTVIQA